MDVVNVCTTGAGERTEPQDTQLDNKKQTPKYKILIKKIVKCNFFPNLYKY